MYFSVLIKFFYEFELFVILNKNIWDHVTRIVVWDDAYESEWIRSVGILPH